MLRIRDQNCSCVLIQYVQVRIARFAPHGGDAVEECALPREPDLGVELGQRGEPVHLLLVVHLESVAKIMNVDNFKHS